MTYFDLIWTAYFFRTQTQSGFCIKKARFERAIRDPDWIRTNDPQLRRLLLYPTELPNRIIIPERKTKENFPLAASVIGDEVVRYGVWGMS